MENSYYQLPFQVVNSIHKDELDKYISSLNLRSQYIKSGQGFIYFVSEYIREGKIQLHTLKDFLFDALFFGFHKETYIWKIKDYNKDLLIENKLLETVQTIYPYVNNIHYNNLSHIHISNDEVEKDKLAALRLIYEGSKLIKIRIIFVTEMRYYVHGSPAKNEKPHETYAFIPVEVDFERSIVSVKAYRKYNVANEIYEYDSLLKRFYSKTRDLLSIEAVPFNELHKKSLYAMCQALVENFYKNLVDTQIDALMPEILAFKTYIIKKVNIDNIENKHKESNIYDIEGRIVQMIENMIISNYFENNDTENLYHKGIQGSITYVKFNDGTNVSATVKGENSYSTVFNSEAFMGLQKAIDNTEKIKEIVVIWFEENDILKSKYDASNIEFLVMQFYTKLEESEFYHALDKYLEYETSTKHLISKMDRNQERISM